VPDVRCFLDGHAATFNLVDQQPIRFDVTVAVVLPSSA
jgi:hypothetical protein